MPQHPHLSIRDNNYLQSKTGVRQEDTGHSRCSGRASVRSLGTGHLADTELSALRFQAKSGILARVEAANFSRSLINTLCVRQKGGGAVSCRSWPPGQPLGAAEITNRYRGCTVGSPGQVLRDTRAAKAQPGICNDMGRAPAKFPSDSPLGTSPGGQLWSLCGVRCAGREASGLHRKGRLKKCENSPSYSKSRSGLLLFLLDDLVGFQVTPPRLVRPQVVFVEHLFCHFGEKINNGHF